jgi:urate oxidase
MSGVLRHNSYGKADVRLTKVVRHSDGRHDLYEFSVDIQLEGDFADSYTAGDNSKVVATDSMKNTVYVLAKENPFDSPEAFALLLARHFVRTYAQVGGAAVKVRQDNWQRITVEGAPHAHSFVNGGGDVRWSLVRLGKTGPAIVQSGIAGLRVVKTTGSEFHTFVTDRYRTLKDTRDRLFGTSVDAEWNWAGESADFNAGYGAIRPALLRTFATHHSLAVQQTLLEMGRAALSAAPAVKSIRLAMPNQHRIPFNLEPFGLKNDNDIFVATDEPYGLITGVVERE